MPAKRRIRRRRKPAILNDDGHKIPWRIVYHSFDWPPDVNPRVGRYWESYIRASSWQKAWNEAVWMSVGTFYEVFEVRPADVEAMRVEWANTTPEDLKFKRVRAKKKPRKKKIVNDDDD